MLALVINGYKSCKNKLLQWSAIGFDLQYLSRSTLKSLVAVAEEAETKGRDFIGGCARECKCVHIIDNKIIMNLSHFRIIFAPRPLNNSWVGARLATKTIKHV